MTIDIIEKIKFDITADRLGPDLPFTSWQLLFKNRMRALCSKKFKYFGKGAEFRFGAYAICCSKISIGKRVVIRPNTMLFADPRKNGAGILIKDDVLVGSGVHFYVSNHKYDNFSIPIIDQGHDVSEEIVLEKGCWIGSNSIILPGVVIGENAVVGAGSIVTKSIPKHVVAFGNPAKFTERQKRR